MKRNDIFKKQKFSIRKFNIGAFSVLIGSTLFMGVANHVTTVEADSEATTAVVSDKENSEADLKPVNNEAAAQPANANVDAEKEQKLIPLRELIAKMDEMVKQDPKFIFADNTLKVNFMNRLAELKAALVSLESGPASGGAIDIAHIPAVVQDVEQNVIAPLNGVTPSHDALKEQIKEAEAIKDSVKYEGATTDKAEAFDKALDKANVVDQNELASANEISSAIDELKAAMEGLNGVNRVELQRLVDDANNVRQSTAYIYAPKTARDGYDSMIAQGEQKLADGYQPDQASVDATVQGIKDAINNLNGIKPDLDAYKQAVSKESQDSVTNSYNYLHATEKEQLNYQTAIAGAKHFGSAPFMQTILNGQVPDVGWTQALQNELNNVITAVNDAVANLKGYFERLHDMFMNFDKVQTSYMYVNSPESYKQAYDKFIAEGQEMYNARTATEAEVNAFIAEMQKAIDNLPGKNELISTVNDKVAVEKTVAYVLASEQTKQAYDNAISAGQQIIEKQGASETEIKDAVAAINAAKAALDGKAANKDALDAALKDANPTKETYQYYNATNTSQEAYNNALANGQKFFDDPLASQTDIDNAVTAINNAKAALDGKATNFTELEQLVNDIVNVQDSYMYLNSSEQKQNAYNKVTIAGQAMLPETDGRPSKASQAEVDAQVAKIKEALANLDGKNQLQEAIANANEELTSDKFANSSKASQTAFEDAIKAAQTVFDKNGATEAEIKDAIAALKKAQDSLDGKATDKSELQTAVENANKVKDTDAFINASKAEQDAFNDAINNAQQVLDKENASQAEVDAAKDALEKAQNALSGKETDKSALKEAIANAQKVKNESLYLHADKDKQDAFNQAIADAQKVLDNPKASQVEVDSAKDALDNALKGLNGHELNWDKLNDALAKFEEMKENDNYKLASAEKKDAALKAYEEALVVKKEGEKASQEMIDKATDALNDALSKLDGNANKNNAEDIISGLDNLDGQQKEDYLDQINNANSKAQLDEIIDAARKANNKDKTHVLPHTADQTKTSLVISIILSTLAIFGLKFNKKRD